MTALKSLTFTTPRCRTLRALSPNDPDEITRERDRIEHQLRTRERWMAALMPARFQRTRSTH